MTPVPVHLALGFIIAVLKLCEVHKQAQELRCQPPYRVLPPAGSCLSPQAKGAESTVNLALIRGMRCEMQARS